MEILILLLIYLILHSYFTYPLVLILGEKFNKFVPDTDSTYLPQVSIVFAAFNEEKIIKAKLLNHLALDYPLDKLQIIVATDLCTDSTNTIISEVSKAHSNILHIEGKTRMGKCSTINSAFNKATGAVIILTDANTIFDKNAVKELVKYFVDSRIGLVCGNLLLSSPDDNIGGKGESLYWKYETLIKEKSGLLGSLVGATGGVYAIRKELFEPFPTTKLIMDDFWLAMRIRLKGYKALYEKNAKVFEGASYSLQEEFNRKVRIGFADFNVIPMLWSALGPKNLWLAFQYFSHKILRWFAPHLAILIFFLSMIGSSESNFLLLIFLLQIMFYIAAFLGIKNKKLYPVTYFVVINLALLKGFVKAVLGNRNLSWTPSKR